MASLARISADLHIAGTLILHRVLCSLLYVNELFVVVFVLIFQSQTVPSCPVDRRPFSDVYKWDPTLGCIQVCPVSDIVSPPFHSAAVIFIEHDINVFFMVSVQMVLVTFSFFASMMSELVFLILFLLLLFTMPVFVETALNFTLGLTSYLKCV